MLKGILPGLPEMGKIKAGTKGEEAVSSEGKRFRLPKKLDHYIITTTERDKEGNLVLDTELMDMLKASDQSITDAEGNLTGIPIRLLYNSIDLNFPTHYANYVGGKLVCFCNGETAKTRDGRTVECPCEKLDPNYKGRDKCKPNGKLYCIIEGASMVGACHVLRTTSINTIKSILGGLAFIKAATGGMLAFLPLHLILTPKTVTIPTTGQLSTIYVSSIVFRGSILDLQRQSLSYAKEKAQYLIEMDSVEATARELMNQSVESELEQQEVQQEFYPDAADDVPSNSKAKPDPEPAHEQEKPEPKPKPKPKPKSEPKPEPVKDESPGPITQDQKRRIVELKKKNKITDPEIWLNLLAPFEVKTANNLTETQGDEFIEVLEKNPF